jgi:hypothetical protein
VPRTGAGNADERHSHDETALLDAVRARPCEFPIAQLGRISERRPHEDRVRFAGPDDRCEALTVAVHLDEVERVGVVLVGAPDTTSWASFAIAAGTIISQ